MTSLSELQLEAHASRERLARSLQELCRHLAPQSLVNEAFEAVAGPEGTSAIKQIESVIRDHPLPMILVSAGGVLWLTGGFKGASTPAATSGKAPAASAQGIKENVLSMGHSVFDKAYEKIEARLTSTLSDYANSAASGVEKVSESVTGSLRGVADSIIEKVSASMREHPLTSSMLVMALSTALGGKEMRKAS
jgi:hypothetical protein